MGKRVLLVEDEAIIALAEKRALEAFGYEVIHAFSGESALAGMDPGIDLVLMDINLGSGMRGTEAAALMLKKRELPIVFLSSNSSEETIRKICAIPHCGYVEKGSGRHTIRSAIETALELHDARAQERQASAVSRMMEEAAGCGYWRLSQDGHSFVLSEGAAELCGLEDTRIPVDAFSDLVLPEDAAARNRALRRAQKGKGTYDVRYRMRRPKDGGIVWIHSTGRVSEAGHFDCGVLRDAGAARAAGKELKKLQAGNTRLLHNIHARVKTSLLVIADLLRLEDDTITESTARTALEDARKRIESLSVLYDKLFKFPDYRSAPVRAYLEELIGVFRDQLLESHTVIDFYTDDFSINIQQLFLIGLIIEELVVNSMKHAFPSGRAGHIHVTLLRHRYDRVELIVSDDGVGMEVGDASPSGVGLALVEEVAGMLSARMERRLGNGTTHKIRFPILQPIPGQG